MGTESKNNFSKKESKLIQHQNINLKKKAWQILSLLRISPIQGGLKNQIFPLGWMSRRAGSFKLLR